MSQPDNQSSPESICSLCNLDDFTCLKVGEKLQKMRKPCCDKKHTNKGAWTKQEDQKLIDYIQTHGEGCWRTLPKEAGLHRCGKSCRLRWINYLRPDIKRGNFAQDEDDLIVKLHALLGNRWSLIAGRLPGRTDNEVKNYWNSHLRRKLISMGIDPNNHRLNQTVPLHKNDQEEPHVSPGIKSSAATIAPSKPEPLKHSADDEQLSDAASGLDDETLRCTCDLNLDLTIAFPSPSHSFGEKKQEIDTAELNNKNKEVECERCPTLALFR